MQFPVIINLHGIDELILLQNATAWHAEPHLQSMPISAQDRFIDSTGAQFSIDAYKSDALIAAGPALNLAEVMVLIQRHAAQDGACCIAKINAPSISAALQMLA
jgi:hypothetical protein